MNTAQTLLIPFEENEEDMYSQITDALKQLKNTLNRSTWRPILKKEQHIDVLQPNKSHTMIKLQSNIGFNDECCTLIKSKSRKLNIGLIDADLLDHGTRHPNLALLKISAFCKEYDHDVRLICDYNEIELKKSSIGYMNYDLIVLSRVFKFTKIPSVIQKTIEKGKIVYGGTGFFEINGPNLPHDVEHHMPDYHLYDEYIEIQTKGDEKLKKRNWDDYLSYSIGFTTRGCIRQCGFCVNRLLKRVVPCSPVSEFLDDSRSKIYLWDDNIMAAPYQVFHDVIAQLQATGKAFQFRQGLDIRLMTDEKAQILMNSKYYGDYIFAFDHYKLDDTEEKKQVEQTIKGLDIWRKYCDKSTKLYVLVAYDSQDERDIEGTFYRIKILMKYGCLPYIMRYEKYKGSKYETLYTQLARWCNQPGFFKKMSFRQFCIRNEEFHHGFQNETAGQNNTRLKTDVYGQRKDTYCACYQAMLDFEKEHPKIAAKYFDLRFEDLKQQKHY